MIFATFDVDILDDVDFIELQEVDAGNAWRFMRLISLAKRINRKGIVTKPGGRPYSIEQLAILHDRTKSAAKAWQEFLTLAVELGLLEWDEEGIRILQWSRWHRSPSSAPEVVREKVAKHRQAKKSAYPTNVTNRNRCNDTEQSRAEHSRAEAEQSREEPEHRQSRAEQSKGDAAAANFLPLSRSEFARLEGKPPPASFAASMESWLSKVGWPWDTAVAAIRYAVDKTLSERKGGKQIRSPWPYVLKIAKEECSAASDWRKRRREAKTEGREDPGRFGYRPTKPKPPPGEAVPRGREAWGPAHPDWVEPVPKDAGNVIDINVAKMVSEMKAGFGKAVENG